MAKHNTIKWALGKSWHKLHPNVQRRFNRLPSEKQPIIYMEVMEHIECARSGWLFSTLTKVIGNPLSPHQGVDIPMTVQLTTRTGKKVFIGKKRITFLTENHSVLLL